MFCNKRLTEVKRSAFPSPSSLHMIKLRNAMPEPADGWPDDPTQNDAVNLITLHQKIAEGLDDIRAGRVVSHDEVFRELKEDDE